MRTIGMLLGIPEDHQEAIRDQLDEGLRIEEGKDVTAVTDFSGGQFADYIDWRPSTRLTT
jgi:hypothetical protein